MEKKGVNPYITKKEYIYDVLKCDKSVIIPTNDFEVWDNKEKYDRWLWTYNKLDIALSQKLKCGPLGVYPDDTDFPIVVKPIINLYGMGKHAQKIDTINDYQTISREKSGLFWMNCLEGDHISLDLIFENGCIVWFAAFKGHKNKKRFGTFKYWELLQQYTIPEKIRAWLKRTFYFPNTTLNNTKREESTMENTPNTPNENEINRDQNENIIDDNDPEKNSSNTQNTNTQNTNTQNTVNDLSNNFNYNGCVNIECIGDVIIECHLRMGDINQLEMFYYLKEHVHKLHSKNTLFKSIVGLYSIGEWKLNEYSLPKELAIIPVFISSDEYGQNQHYLNRKTLYDIANKYYNHDRVDGIYMFQKDPPPTEGSNPIGWVRLCNISTTNKSVGLEMKKEIEQFSNTIYAKIREHEKNTQEHEVIDIQESSQNVNKTIKNVVLFVRNNLIGIPLIVLIFIFILLHIFTA